jgi:hypothetical protein
MSAYPSDNHIYKLKVSQQELKLEGLHTHYQLLEVLCTRHEIWARDASNQEAARCHSEVADSLQKVRNLIDHILDTYRQDGRNHS